MKLDGLTPSQGPTPQDRLSADRKTEPKAGGKSFGAALDKARSAQGPDGAGVGKGAAQPPAASPANPAEPPPTDPSMDSHIDTIRYRLQSGYYNNPKVDDALSDKLSGYFDDVA